ncbi:fatty acid-binding protein, muscle-like [Homalodisca vitripennis]|uniref:fatty acid-binding protein, muscle-like n=1 Tax=Homalodisca vitripennis TaxID=197043 RepID=UPI001EEADD5E|nr:fatty acid-binding protein, muscle-like [Homalodisca vitripennis]
MKIVAVTLLAVVACGLAVAGDAEDRAALAPVLNKKYKLASSENFEEVMAALGVGWITRKLGNAASPVIELTENNGEYSLTSKSTFKDTDLRFRIGQEFTEETPDGRMVKSIITQKGNVLTHVQTGVKVTTIVRTFTPEEIKMVITVGDIVSTRIYKPE